MAIQSKQIKEAIGILKEMPTIALNNQMLNIEKMKEIEEFQIFLKHLDESETITFLYLIQCSYTHGVTDGIDISKDLDQSIKRILK
jgi:hypothetical protein